MSKSISLFAVTALIIIPFIKKFTTARKGLALQYQEGIQVYIKVINIFLVAKFTIYYTKSVIYAMSLDIIRKTIATTAEFNGVQVHWVIL